MSSITDVAEANWEGMGSVQVLLHTWCDFQRAS
jgi:hypothetical protein